MSGFLQDIILSHRSLISRPGFTITAVLTLALGIGVNTIVFCVVHALFLQPLPLENPEQLVVVHETDPSHGISFDSCSMRMFLALREQNSVFTHLTAWYERDTNVGLPDQPVQVIAWQTTADFFPTMGLKPKLGRGFFPSETRIGSPRDVAVIGHRFWQQHFGADPEVVGRVILVDDLPATIVGVMPPNEQWLDADLLMPLPNYVTDMSDRRILSVVGRLKDGQTIAAAEAQLQAIAAIVQK